MSANLLHQHEVSPCDGTGNVPDNSLDEITLQAIDMLERTRQAVERLAGERTRLKMSAHRATAVAKELGQLRIVLGNYTYKHPADTLSSGY